MSHFLVINAGSSSLKFAVFDAGLNVVLKGQEDLATADGTTLGEAQHKMVQRLNDAGYAINEFTGVGHRIVHGGTKYVLPTLVDDTVQDDLRDLCHLAPLHLPFGLDALRNLREAAPNVPHVACFDTAFHATQPEIATRLPLPRAYHERGYRRYGFHGLNYEHVVKALPEQTGQVLPERLLVAHLGNGASMCAIKSGKSIATTMGFSTADGLVMGTRTGAIDPGVLIALMRDDHLSLEELEDLLYRKSGLLGLSGISSDMRELLASKKQEAIETVDYYCYSAARYASSLVTALGGIDAIAFTGGIGENAIPVRAKIMDHLRWLNLDHNSVHIVKANEELAIARHVAELLLH
jgi:acetate kinase